MGRSHHFGFVFQRGQSLRRKWIESVSSPPRYRFQLVASELRAAEAKLAWQVEWVEAKKRTVSSQKRFLFMALSFHRNGHAAKISR